MGTGKRQDKTAHIRVISTCPAGTTPKLKVLFRHSPLPSFMPNVSDNQYHLSPQPNPNSPYQLAMSLLNCIRDCSRHRMHQTRCLLFEGAMQSVEMLVIILAV